MRVVVLTSSRHGTASRCLPELVASPAIHVAGVVLSQNEVTSRLRHVVRRIHKIRKIGPLGALNGIRMRSWFHGGSTEDLNELCARLDVPLWQTPCVNCETTQMWFRHADADLGLSLGNPYIGKSVFSIPRHGMINVHGEQLPAFRGAQSVIWPIHEGVPSTGLSIHQIDEQIDNGRILHRLSLPIEFCETLRETVEHNVARVAERTPAAVREVCERYEELAATAAPQGPGSQSFTTPSARQYRSMVRKHRQLRDAATVAKAADGRLPDRLRGPGHG